MNEKDIKTRLKKLKEVKLSETSRKRIWDSLEAYADFHSADIVDQTSQGARVRRLLGVKLTHVYAALLIFVLVGGTTSFAAERAVPGETLYAMKVEVNERVKTALAFNNASKAELHARLAEERLLEAEELAARGTLNPEVSERIRTRLETHYLNASERSNRAEFRGDLRTSATVRASLEGTFRTYADVLSRIDAQVGRTDTEEIVEDIEVYADTEADAQIEATTTVDTTRNAREEVLATINRAEMFLGIVETKLKRAESRISARMFERIRTRFSAAEAALAEAEIAFRNELYREALFSAQNTIRISKEVESMINTVIRLRIDFDITPPVRTDAVSTTTDADSEESVNEEEREEEPLLQFKDVNIQREIEPSPPPSNSGGNTQTHTDVQNEEHTEEETDADTPSDTPGSTGSTQVISRPSAVDGAQQVSD